MYELCFINKFALPCLATALELWNQIKKKIKKKEQLIRYIFVVLSLLLGFRSCRPLCPWLRPVACAVFFAPVGSKDLSCTICLFVRVSLHYQRCSIINILQTSILQWALAKHMKMYNPPQKKQSTNTQKITRNVYIFYRHPLLAALGHFSVHFTLVIEDGTLSLISCYSLHDMVFPDTSYTYGPCAESMKKMHHLYKI